LCLEDAKSFSLLLDTDEPDHMKKNTITIILFSFLTGYLLTVSGRYIIEMNRFPDFIINVLTEFLGIGVTLFLIDKWIERKEEARRKPHKEALMTQYISSYYVICIRLKLLINSLVFAHVDDDFKWVTGRLQVIELTVDNLKNLDNMAQDLFSFTKRNEFLQLNSSIEAYLSSLRLYEEYPLHEVQVIMGLMELTLIINIIATFIENNAESEDFDLDEIRMPIFSRDEARQVYDRVKAGMVRSREF